MGFLILILNQPLLTRFFTNPLASEAVTNVSSPVALPVISPRQIISYKITKKTFQTMKILLQDPSNRKRLVFCPLLMLTASMKNILRTR